jgi:hypothetical protein
MIQMKLYPIIIILSLVLCQTGCKKFIEVKPPVTSIDNENVYITDATAIAVLTGLYTNISQDNIGLNGLMAMSIYPGLSADELTLFSGSTEITLISYYRNLLKSNGAGALVFWSKLYSMIYVTNAAIEGVNKSGTLTPAIKNQLLGEAYFMRAFSYFYLVNLYGDVPIVISTDYTITASLSRSPSTEVYKQITDDLIKARSLLNENYLDISLLKNTFERVRPNKATADALLSRTYLYTRDWTNAEIQATNVINNQSLYDTVPLNEVFLKNSKETIWALQPVGIGTQTNTGDGRFFILPPDIGPSSENPVYLSDQLFNSFEPGDQRQTNWTNNITLEGTTYHYAFKYKIGAEDRALSEYIMVFRLAEQYLIRAEARAQQGNLNGAGEDLNIIRTRAGLAHTTATTQGDLLNAILHERQVELFTEWGHRWLDIKRTKTIDAIMPAVCEQKGGTWDSRWSLYPIPLQEVQRAANLKQNPGYESN